jgi:hypothetical protein
MNSLFSSLLIVVLATLAVRAQPSQEAGGNVQDFPAVCHSEIRTAYAMTGTQLDTMSDRDLLVWRNRLETCLVAGAEVLTKEEAVQAGLALSDVLQTGTFHCEAQHNAGAPETTRKVSASPPQNPIGAKPAFLSAVKAGMAKDTVLAGLAESYELIKLDDDDWGAIHKESQTNSSKPVEHGHTRCHELKVSLLPVWQNERGWPKTWQEAMKSSQLRNKIKSDRTNVWNRAKRLT